MIYKIHLEVPVLLFHFCFSTCAICLFLSFSTWPSLLKYIQPQKEADPREGEKRKRVAAMIRVFAPFDIPEMDIIELQGQITILPEAETAARLAKKQQQSVSTAGNTPHSPARQGDDTVEVPLGHLEQDQRSAKRCTLCIDTLHVDGSRSSLRHPLLVLKRCSTARVAQLATQCLRSASSGARSASPPPVAPSSRERVSCNDRDEGDAVAEPTMLFSAWLSKNPEATRMENLFLPEPLSSSVALEENGLPAGEGSRKRARDDKDADGDLVHSIPHDGPDTTKDYEVIGVVHDATLFNSKPARVFRR